MRTIALVLCRRPDLVAGCVEALVNCQELDKFDELLFSIDGGFVEGREVAKRAEACALAISDAGLISCDIVSRGPNLGVAAHPLACLSWAFEQKNSDLHVQVEDDGLLKPDALRLALWFQEFKAKSCPEATLLGMSNHRDFGKGQHPEIPEDDPALIAEALHIPSPFAWATTPDEWEFLGRWWDFKRVSPHGWDYSLSMAMRIKRRISLHPILSRCQNVGRVGGVHESPKTFDLTQLGVKYREDRYDGDYSVVARVDGSDLNKLDDWMLGEWARIQDNPDVQDWGKSQFLERLRSGFERATDVKAIAPCRAFAASIGIDATYADVPKSAGAPNPWHVGTLGAEGYPRPHELIQAELELLAHMFTMVVQLKPKLVVETGTNVGLMARALGAGCFANGFGRVVTSDVDAQMVEYAKRVCEGLPVEVRCCPSLELPELGEADLVFVDSSYASRSQEIHRVKSGAVYVYHDSLSEPWVRPEMEHEKFKVHLDSPRGFSIVRKP